MSILPDAQPVDKIFDYEKKKSTKPPVYKVYVYNDNYTPIDFVIKILVNIFHKDIKEAVKITFCAHNNGMSLCGVFPFEIAEIRIERAQNISSQLGYPLKFTIQKK